MRKANLAEAICNKEYKLALMRKLGLCCAPHKGCNRRCRERWAPNRNWKMYRKNQWKDETFF
jgi:hypothetical protein